MATILVGSYEEGCGQVCLLMPGVPASESRASETYWFVTLIADPRMEVGSHCYEILSQGCLELLGGMM